MCMRAGVTADTKVRSCLCFVESVIIVWIISITIIIIARTAVLSLFRRSVMNPKNIFPRIRRHAGYRFPFSGVTIGTILFTAVMLIGCGRELMDTTPRVRHIKTDGVEDFHKPIRLTVGWMSYEEESVVSDNGSTYHVEPADALKTGRIPALQITYEDGTTSTLDMNISNELLGQLIKSSLMSEQPIRRPYSEFMQTADCSNCHPSEVKIR